VTKEKSSNKGLEEDALDSSEKLRIEHSSVPTDKETLDQCVSVDCEPIVKPDSDIDDGGPLSI
jgi:hypothetical protein